MSRDKRLAATALAAIAFAGFAAGAAGAWVSPRDPFGGARPVNISLTNFSISPRELHLKAGEPVMLRISNDSSSSHDLTAPEFFSNSAIGAADAARVAGGRVALGGHQEAIIRLTPRAGRYAARCSHLFHKMLGMSGAIVVDQ